MDGRYLLSWNAHAVCKRSDVHESDVLLVAKAHEGAVVGDLGDQTLPFLALEERLRLEKAPPAQWWARARTRLRATTQRGVLPGATRGRDACEERAQADETHDGLWVDAVVHCPSIGDEHRTHAGVVLGEPAA